jgi:hypothetical protein
MEAHTPEQIRLANLARAKLRRQFPAQKVKWAAIKDERRPKRPQGAYVIFSVTRQSSGDFAHIKLTDRGKLIADEWRALSDSEKSVCAMSRFRPQVSSLTNVAQKYEQAFKKNSERYAEEFIRVYGHPPPNSTAAVAATA